MNTKRTWTDERAESYGETLPSDHVYNRETMAYEPTNPAQRQATHSPRKLVRIYMEGGVIQDVDVPKGVEVVTIDQDEIECGEQGTFVYDGGPDETVEALAEALTFLIGCAERGLDQSPTHDGLSNCKAISNARKTLSDYDASHLNKSNTDTAKH